jgi:hypothetical protein
MAKKTIKKDEEKEVAQEAPETIDPEVKADPPKADPPEDNTEPTPPKKETRETLCPPWITYRNEVEMLFEQDPEVSVSKVTPSEDRNQIMSISSKNIGKMRAISMLIPTKISFGNVNLNIKFNIIDNCATVADIYRSAFAGNPALEEIIENVPAGKVKFIYLLFQKKVVQFWNDNAGDPYGNIATLYQEIANNVCKKYENVYFCTQPDPMQADPDPMQADDCKNSCK